MFFSIFSDSSVKVSIFLSTNPKFVLNQYKIPLKNPFPLTFSVFVSFFIEFSKALFLTIVDFSNDN